MGGHNNPCVQFSILLGYSPWHAYMVNAITGCAKDFTSTKLALDVWFVTETAVALDHMFEATPDPSASEAASSSAPEAIMAMIKLTMASTTPAIPNRRQAQAWASKIVDAHVQNASVKKVVCFREGQELRIDIENIMDRDLMQTLIPAFTKFGIVKRCGVEEIHRVLNIDKNIATTRQAKAEVVGDLASMTSMTEMLVQFRGTGGPPRKRRRFADRAQEMLLRSQSVASDGLQSAQISNADDNSSEGD